MKSQESSLPRMTRKTFLKAAAVFSASAPPLDMGAAQSRFESLDEGESGCSPLTLGNTEWQLHLEPGAGLKAEVVQTPSGVLLAIGNYSYSLGTPSFVEAQVSQEGWTKIVRLTGEIPGGIELEHEFRAPAEEPWVEEQITGSNRGTGVLALPFGRCGSVLPVALEAGTVPGRLRDFKVTAVPYRREPSGNRSQYAEYTLLQVLSEPLRQPDISMPMHRSELWETHLTCRPPQVRIFRVQSRENASYSHE